MSTKKKMSAKKKPAGEIVELRIGNMNVKLRAIPAEEVAKANIRIQKKLDPFLRNNKKVRTRARYTASKIVLPCSPLIWRL